MILWLALPLMWLLHRQYRVCQFIIQPLTQQSRHRMHLSPSQGRKDPA